MSIAVLMVLNIAQPIFFFCSKIDEVDEQLARKCAFCRRMSSTMINLNSKLMAQELSNHLDNFLDNNFRISNVLHESIVVGCYNLCIACESNL